MSLCEAAMDRRLRVFIAAKIAIRMLPRATTSENLTVEQRRRHDPPLDPRPQRIPAALHAHLQLTAELCRAVVCGADHEMDQTQRPPLNHGPGRLDPHLDHQRKRETPRHVWHTTADEILATPVGKNPQIHAVGIPAARLAGVVDRAGKLSDELLKSLETSERAAIEAVGRFVITIEEALPHEVTGTADVAKLITESGLEMADRLVHTEYALLRDVVDSAANSLRRHDGGKARRCVESPTANSRRIDLDSRSMESPLGAGRRIRRGSSPQARAAVRRAHPNVPATKHRYRLGAEGEFGWSPSRNVAAASPARVKVAVEEDLLAGSDEGEQLWRSD